ncbi:MAG: hypothetical protein Q9P01_00750 [Anaerolineae bacterium]|nr:hypothetical protein [Anaerolineae bacterium]
MRRAGTTIAADAATSPEVVEATPPPVEVAQATPAPQQATVGGDGVVTAQVILDPSANLQLRQYPDPNSLSLGLAPANTTLVIDGREGRPVALVDGQDPPPEAEDFVDPINSLGEDEDLASDTTWLRVIYAPTHPMAVKSKRGYWHSSWLCAMIKAIYKPSVTYQRLPVTFPVKHAVQNSPLPRFVKILSQREFST